MVGGNSDRSGSLTPLTANAGANLGAQVRPGLNRLNITVLLGEHDMAFVMDICGRLLVVDLGGVIAPGASGQIRDNPAVHAAYLG